MANPNPKTDHLEATQFTSENQPEHNGRPKGKKNLKTMLVELLSSQDPEGEWSKSVAGQLIRKAYRDNDLRALQEIIDRIEGKLVQKSELSGGVTTERLVIIKETKIDENQTKGISRRLSIQPSEVPCIGGGSGHRQDNDAPCKDSQFL